jgi:hypothetical protein
MEITEAFDTFNRHGHVIDQYIFYYLLLGKQPGYFAYFKSTDNQPSIETLMLLHFELLTAEKAYSTYLLNTGELRDLASSMVHEVWCARIVVTETVIFCHLKNQNPYLNRK